LGVNPQTPLIQKVKMVKEKKNQCKELAMFGEGSDSISVPQILAKIYSKVPMITGTKSMFLFE
jgi:hypothetical protein